MKEWPMGVTPIKEAVDAARTAVIAKCDDEMAIIRVPHIRSLLAEISRLEGEWVTVRAAANRAIGPWPPLTKP
jgi:hypothetical protein